ncbi:MAG: peroxide stress protein YaaA [Flavobacteriaceae bacterium]
MKILISPAKSLDFESKLPQLDWSVPFFEKEAIQINSVLKKKSPKNLQKLMSISEKLAQLNWERNQYFGISENFQKRPAVFAFDGDVYSGLSVQSLSIDSILIMQEKIRILSGLYGLLRPLDQILPYRLEMGTYLKVGNHKNLYDFWKSKVTNVLQNELKTNEILVNLASAEYYGVVDIKTLNVPIVSPQFKDFKNGNLKMISFFAKKARGMMARFLIEKEANTLEDIKGFTSDGYVFSSEHTKNELEPVFIR